MTGIGPPFDAVKPARLTRAEAHDHCILAQRVRDVAFEWVGVPWRLTLEPRPDQEGMRAGPSDWRLTMSWSGLPFDLLLPETAVHTWIRARFPDLDIPELPEPLAVAALETACDSVVSLLGAGSHGPVRIEQLSPGPHENHRFRHVIALELAGRASVLRALVATSAQGLAFLARLARGRPVATNAIGCDDLPITLFAQIGMTWLSPAQVGRLVLRDTILFDQRLLQNDGHLWIERDGWGLHVRREGQSLKVATPLNQTGGTMYPEDDEHAGRSRLGSLEDIPLRVMFDLGELSMTLGELQGLQAGQALALARPLSDAVHIRVNGALIGTGELVDIDGEMGVTVTALFHQPAAKRGRASGTRQRKRQAAAAGEDEAGAP